LSHGVSPGIYIDYSNDTDIIHNIASNLAAGIKMDFSYWNTAINNTMNDNQVGIQLTFANNNTISFNKLRSNTIRVWYSNGNHVLNNSVTLNTMYNYNIQVTTYSNYNVIAGNLVSNSSTNGIVIDTYCTYNTISGNMITNNSISGIFLSSHSDNNTITKNQIVNNTQNGINIDFTIGNVIVENVFIGNAVQAVCTSSANIKWDMNSRGNLWGDYSSRYPTATNDGAVWSIPYTIGTGQDNYPLACNPVDNSPAIPVLTITTSSPVHSTTIELSWTTVTNADRYLVYRHSTAISAQNLKAASLCTNTTQISFTDHVPWLGTYYYAIVAINASGSSLPSNSPSIIVQESLATPSLTIDTLSPSLSHNISLSWVAVPGASNYTIYRALTAISQANIAAAYSIITTSLLTDSDIVPSGGVFYYAIIARNDSGISQPSNSPWITVESLPPAPVLTILTTSPTNSLQIELSWSSVSGATTYTLYRLTSPITGANLAQATILYTGSLRSFSDYSVWFATYWYAVTATNTTGESMPSTSHSISIFDSNPPVIFVMNAVYLGSYKTGYSIELSIWDDIELTGVLYNWDAAANMSLSYPYSVTIPGAEGIHNLSVYASDYNNTENLSFQFITDNTAPIIMLLSPQNNTNHLPGAGINLSITDSNPIGFVQYSWNHGSNQSLNSPFNLTLPATDGIYTLQIHARDEAGNLASIQYRFIVDGTAPVITLNSPANASVVRSTAIIHLDVVDANNATVIRNWDGGTNATIVAPFDVPVLATPGLHRLNVYATDSIGNIATRSYQFNILVVPAAPVLEHILPVIDVDGIIHLNWNTVPGATIYYVYQSSTPITTVENISAVSSTNMSEYVDTILANGTYYYTIVAGNSSGNGTRSNVENVTVALPPANPSPNGDPTTTIVVICIIAGCSAGIVLGIMAKQGKLQKIAIKKKQRADPTFDAKKEKVS